MLKQMWRVHVLIGLFLGISACASPNQPRPSDIVRDEARAISIGKKACSERGGDTEGRWTAKFDFGIWNVEHLYSTGDPKCNWERVKVWADNGKANSCEICVVAT